MLPPPARQNISNPPSTLQPENGGIQRDPVRMGDLDALAYHLRHPRHSARQLGPASPPTLLPLPLGRRSRQGAAEFLARRRERER